MITNKDYLSSIRKCYLFDGIEDEKLTEAIMLFKGRIRKIQKDEFIVRLGDELQSAGLLLKGRIESSFQNESFDQITMHRFGGGYLFGEALVINDTKISPVQVRAAAFMLVGTGVAEIGPFVGAGVEVSAADVTPTESFEYVENSDVCGFWRCIFK